MPPLPLTFRKAKPEDAGAVFAVHKASVHGLCGTHYSISHIDAWFEDRTPEIYRVALEAGKIWVAEESRSIVGFAAAEPGEVTLLFVSPAHAGCGIGKKLLELALSKATQGHTGPITVVATLNSSSFYEECGFEAVEEQAFVRGQHGLRYPVVRMVQRTLNAGAHGAAATDA